jgi:hypothetical protein
MDMAKGINIENEMHVFILCDSSFFINFCIFEENFK